jgi:SH3-like domain-containing protein
MTRARALKQAIRTRAARTGERYTTARRHLLNSLAPVAAVEVPVQATASAATSAAVSKRSAALSEKKIRERTGHGLDYWFEVLDRFGAVTKGHTATARHLHDAHGVDGWYAQSVTVAYERARGVRAANQRCDGAFEVSVSKMIAADVPAIVRAMTSPRLRARLSSTDPDLVPALAHALAAPASKGFVVRADGLGRYRYRWGSTTVQFYLVPRSPGKVSAVVTNMKLASGELVERRRQAWRDFLQSLAELV